MNYNELFYKAVLDQDPAPVVLCDLNHTVFYMNDAAKLRYAADGGAELIGKSVLGCHPPYAVEMIHKVLSWFRENPANNVVYTFRNNTENKDVYMIALRDDAQNLIGYYEKHSYRDVETMKLYDMK